MRGIATIVLLTVVIGSATACSSESDTTGRASPTGSGSPHVASSDANSICAKLGEEVMSTKRTDEITAAFNAVVIAQKAKDAAKTTIAEAALTAALTKQATEVITLADAASEPATKDALQKLAASLTKAADLSFLHDLEAKGQTASWLGSQLAIWLRLTYTACPATK